MIDHFQNPLPSRSRDIVYVSPPAPVRTPEVAVAAGTYGPIYLFEDSIALSLLGQKLGVNLPPGFDLQTEWTSVSGPAPVSFTDRGSLTTQALFTQPGTYVLELSAQYEEAFASQQTTIEVRPVVYTVNNSMGYFNHPESQGINIGSAVAGFGLHLLVWVRTGPNTRALVGDVDPTTLLNATHPSIDSGFHTDWFKALPGVQRELFITLWNESTNQEWPVNAAGSPYNPANGQFAAGDSWMIFSLSTLPGEFGIDFPAAFGGTVYRTIHEEHLNSVIIPDYTKRGGEIFVYPPPQCDNPTVTIRNLGGSSVHVTSPNGIDFNFATQGNQFTGAPFEPGLQATLIFDLSGHALLAYSSSAFILGGPFFERDGSNRPIIRFIVQITYVPYTFTITSA